MHATLGQTDCGGDLREPWLRTICGIDDDHIDIRRSGAAKTMLEARCRAREHDKALRQRQRGSSPRGVGRNGEPFVRRACDHAHSISELRERRDPLRHRVSGNDDDIRMSGSTTKHSALPGDGAFRQQLWRLPRMQIPHRYGDLVVIMQAIVFGQRCHQRRRVDEPTAHTSNDPELPRACELAPRERKGARIRKTGQIGHSPGRNDGLDRATRRRCRDQTRGQIQRGRRLIRVDDLRDLVENDTQLGTHTQRVSAGTAKSASDAGPCLNAQVSDGRLPVQRRWIRWTISTIVTLLVLAIGWVVIRGVSAVSEMQNVANSASQMRTAIAEGELPRAELVAPRVAQHAASAHDLTSDPIWRGFEFIPWLGPNFTAMREVAEVADSIAADAVTPVLEIAGDIDLASFGFSGATIDLAPLAEVEAPLATASATLSTAETQAQQIDADAALPPLADAVREMRDVVTEAATVVGAFHGASVLLPPMLGAEGPRTYVVAMQNNAELRSSGGIVGSLALLSANNGTISIVQQASTRDFPALDVPLPLSESTVSLFEDRPGRFMQNITSIPDFSEAGATMALRWEQQFGQSVDGVIAIDAVVAQHLIGATGEIAFGPFTADADNILPILLSEIYASIPDPAQQDDVFAQAANVLFAAALSNPEPQKLIGALASAADEDRIRIWSAHPEEQDLLAASTLGGALPVDGERGPYVGVLINDATGGKMNFYTSASISTAVGVCRGEPTTQVRVTWTNDAPLDAAETLPEYVTGGGWYEVQPGDVRTLIAIYGPEGATLRSDDRDGEEEGVQTTTLGTRSVVQHDVLLAPGESSTITVSFTGTGAGDRLTRVQHTPMIDTPEPTRAEFSCL